MNTPGEDGIQPGVPFAPDDPHGSLHRVEQVLELGGVLLVELGDFLKVSFLPVLAPPSGEVPLERRFIHRAVDGGGDVGGRDPFVDVRWHRAVNVQVRLHVPGRRRYPGTEDDRVDEGDAVERHLVQKMTAEHDRAAYVVARYRGRFQPPQSDELGEYARLGRDGDVLSLRLGVPIPKKIEHVDGEPIGEPGNHVTPQVRPTRGAVYQNDRRSLPERVEGYITLRQARAPTETPTASWPPSHERPTTWPCSSMSMLWAAGAMLRPGMVRM